MNKSTQISRADAGSEANYLDLAGEALLAGMTREQVIAQLVSRIRRDEGYLAYRKASNRRTRYDDQVQQVMRALALAAVLLEETHPRRGDGLASHLPEHADLGTPAVLRLLSVYSSAQALAHAPLDDVARTHAEASAGRWGPTHAQALSDVAQHSAASTRAVAARAVVVRTLGQHLLDLHARIAELELALAEVLRTDPPSQQVPGPGPGLGPTWTATIRAEVGDVQRFQRVDQLVAYAGLEPRTHESGRFVGQRRLSKRGPGELRHALSMATLVAVRFRPEWRLRYQRLLDRGRAKKEARTILARKLLKVIYHLLRTGASYDPARLSPAPPAGQA